MKAKKILASLIATVMMLSTIVCPVFAAEGAAKIGETSYSTLADAIAAADGETTITVADGTHTMPGSVANKNITIEGTAYAIVEMKDTVNGTGSTINFKGVTVDFDNQGYEGITHSTKVTYTGCKHIGTEFLYAPEVSYTNCTFEITGDAYAVWTYGAKDVDFIDCIFNTDGKAILVYIEGEHKADINVEGCTFNATTDRGKAAIELGESAYGNTAKYNVEIKNSTAEDKFVANNSESNLLGNKNDMNLDFEEVDGNITATAATYDIDDFKAALLESKGADGNYVFDGKGKTYKWTIGNTVNKGDANAPDRYNSKNAQYYLLNGEVGSVTLKNVNFIFTAPSGNVAGNIVGSGEVVNAAQLYFENTGDFTVENCTFNKTVLTNFYGEGTATVKDCTFTDITDSYAVKDIRGKNIIVSDNAFTNCSGGIMVSAVSNDFEIADVDVAGNTFTNVSSDEKNRGLVQLAKAGVYAPEAVSYVNNTATDSGSTFRLLNDSSWSDVYELVANSNGALTLTDDSKDSVAGIGTKVYASLQSAINAAKTGETVTLLADVSEKGTEVGAGSGEFFVQILDKDVTIDLGGYTLNGSLYLNSGAKLAIDNGKIRTFDGNKSSCIESVGGSIELGTQLDAHSSVRHCIRVKGGSAVINGGTYKADGNSTYHTVNISNASNVVIKDGTFISNKGNSTAGGNAVMIQDAASTVKISGGSFSNASGSEGAICAAAGLEISGGEFDTWTYDNYLAEGYWAFQKYQTKNMFFVEEKKEAPKATVEENGSITVEAQNYTNGNAKETLTLESAYTFIAPHTTADEALNSQYSTWNADFVVSVDKDIPANSIVLAGNYGAYGWISFTNPEPITAGTEIRLLKDIGRISMNYYELCTLVNEFKCGVADIDNALDGVNFTVKLNMYEVEPYTDKNTTWNTEKANSTPVLSNDVKYEIGSDAKPVAKIGETGYETLQEAINAATAGQTITLVNDITVDEEKTSGCAFLVGPTADITLDLNGHNIKGTVNASANYSLINVQGKLNVVGNGTIELTNTDNSTAWAFTSSAIALNNHDGYTVDTALKLGEGVTVKHNGGTVMAYAVDMMTYTGCSVDVEGANLSSTYAAIRIFGNNGNKALNISAGTVEGASRAVWVQHNGSSDVDLTVSGGTIKSAEGNGLHISTEAGSKNSLDVSITGGTFDAANPIALRLNESAAIAPAVTKAETVTLAAPEGYEWKDNGDGTYGIVKETASSVTITNTGKSVSFASELYINFYFTAEGIEKDYVLENGGVLTWKVGESRETAYDSSEFKYVDGNGFTGRTKGIAAKEYADTYYMCAYIDLEDGTRIYGDTQEYSVEAYCEALIKSDNSKIKVLGETLKAYGAAAAAYFNYSPLK